MTKSSWFPIARACPPLHKLLPDTISTLSHQDQSYSALSNRIHVRRQSNCAEASPRTESSLSKPLRSSGSMVHRQPFSFTEGTLPKDLQRNARPQSIAESNSQLGLQLIHAKSSRQSNGMVAAITPRQSSSVVRPLIRSGRQLNAIHHSPRQSATTIRSAYHPSQKEKTVDADEESSSSSSTREYGRRNKP